jgi:hypothetical protein
MLGKGTFSIFLDTAGKGDILNFLDTEGERGKGDRERGGQGQGKGTFSIFLDTEKKLGMSPLCDIVPDTEKKLGMSPFVGKGDILNFS